MQHTAIRAALNAALRDGVLIENFDDTVQRVISALFRGAPVGVEHPILDHGFLALDSFLADDLSVVNAARVSLHKHHDEMKKGDAELIAFLMKNKHGTPFEHNFFRFRIKAPLFVFREWHRHRIGHSYNEWSARYSELANCYYIPAAQDVRQQIGKPGAYTYVIAPEELSSVFRDDLVDFSKISWDYYRKHLDAGIAKEQARLFLSVGVFSEMYWSCNARSLMAFLELRNAPSAMWEIRQYAIAAEEIFSQIMPITAAAFATTRTAP